MSNRERDEDDGHAGRAGGGVVSGEATPPDEHTRRVQALKRGRGEGDATLLQVHDGPEPEARAGRGAVAHDSPTTARAAVADAAPSRPQVAVRAHGAPAPAVEGGASAGEAPSRARAPEGAASAVVAAHPASAAASGAADAAPAEAPRTTDVAERSRKDRRRARDRRAEQTAVRVAVAFFVVLGLGLYALFESELLNGPPEEGSEQAARPKPKPRPKPVTTAPIDETPDLPALRMLAADGLTIAAEGLPAVEVVGGSAGPEASVAAAVESCRFAFGVWEFSPNKRFRFLTTCQALEGQILVGAYEIRGSKVLMSPLSDPPSTLVSVLEVEKPSEMRSQVTLGSGSRAVVLVVTQRVTTLRGGLQGEAFRDTYAPRNTLQIAGGRPRGGGAAPAGAKTGKDPLFEALKQGQATDPSPGSE